MVSVHHDAPNASVTLQPPPFNLLILMEGNFVQLEPLTTCAAEMRGILSGATAVAKTLLLITVWIWFLRVQEFCRS